MDTLDVHDVLEASWPRTIDRQTHVVESLNRNDDRSEWLNSGFLARTINSLVACDGLNELAKTPQAITMRSLRVHWMRWITRERLLVIFVHPNNSLMGVEMTLAQVKKVFRTRAWFENNAEIHMFRPFEQACSGSFSLLRHQREALAWRILFPHELDVDDMEAWTEVLQFFLRDEHEKDLRVLTFEESKSTKSAIKKKQSRSLPLYGAGVRLVVDQNVVYILQEQGEEWEKIGRLITDEGHHEGHHEEQETKKRREYTPTSRLLLVGSVLAHCSAAYCSLGKERTFDESEEAALRTLVESHGSFLEHLTMKRFHLRRLHDETVWWIVYPRTTRLVDNSDPYNPTYEFGHPHIPGTLYEAYTKMLDEVHKGWFDQVLPTAGEQTPGAQKREFKAFKGREGLLAAARSAAARGGERVGHLLLAVAITETEMNAHRDALVREYSDLNNRVRKAYDIALVDQREALGEFEDRRLSYSQSLQDTNQSVQEWQRDPHVAVVMEQDDPLREYKLALRDLKGAERRKRKRKEAEEDDGAILFHPSDGGLVISWDRLLLGVAFRDFVERD